MFIWPNDIFIHIYIFISNCVIINNMYITVLTCVISGNLYAIN